MWISLVLVTMGLCGGHKRFFMGMGRQKRLYPWYAFKKSYTAMGCNKLCCFSLLRSNKEGVLKMG